MNLPRRRFLHLTAGAAVLPALPRVARAQAYPARPVRIVVGFPAGGNNDIVARVMGQWLSERLGQSFVVENRPGAANNLAAEMVVRSPPDGYTLLLAGLANASNASLYEKLSFNFVRDIAPVAGILRVPLIMIVNPSVPAKTVPEFIAYAKANPGKLNMSSGGNGGPQHISGELFKMLTGISMVHVPYRGEAPALNDLIGGQVQVQCFVARHKLINGRHVGQRFQARRSGDSQATQFSGSHVLDGSRDAGEKRMARSRRTQGHFRRDHQQAQRGD